MEWMIAGAAIFFFICLVAWCLSLYSKQSIAARTPREPDYMRTRRRNLKGKPPKKSSPRKKGKLPSGYTPIQPIYPPTSTPPEPPQSPAPPQPVVEVQPTPLRPAKLTPWKLAGTNYRKILTFVDQKTAERLLKSASYKYPEKSEGWIVDKVLWDLQRDKFRG